MKKRIISLLLALSMMISLVPVSALADTGGGTTPLAAGGGSRTTNSNGSTISGGVHDDNISNYGTIEGGTFNGEVTNRYSGHIYHGIFNNDVWNEGLIMGGTFKGTVTNYNSWTGVPGIANGTGYKPIFVGKVINEGTVNGGIFLGNFVNETTTTSGNAVTGEVKNGIFKDDPKIDNVKSITVNGATIKEVGYCDATEYGMSWGTTVYAASGTGVVIHVDTKVNAINGKDPSEFNGGLYDDGQMIIFTMPDEPVVLSYIAPKDLQFGEDGKPTAASGNGWTYDGTTLKLTSGEWDFSNSPEIRCNVDINKDAVLKDGTINATVKNYGTIEGGTIRFCDNYGTIVNGTFDNPNGMYCIWNYNLISGGVFEQSIQACVENGVASKITGGTFKDGFYTSGSGEGTIVEGGTFASPPTNATGKRYSVSIGSWSGKCNIAINGVDFGENQSVYVVGQDYNDVKITATAFDTYIDTKTNTTKKFKEWQISPTGATLNAVDGGTVDLTQKEIEFFMPDSYKNITLAAEYETVSTPTFDPSLVIDSNYIPDRENREKIYAEDGETVIGWKGDGWKYDSVNEKLTLNPESEKEFTLNGSWYLECDLEVGKNAIVKGTIDLTRNVTNYGTIDGVDFASDAVTYPSLINNGTVKNCMVHLASSVTNNKTMENVSFVTCSKLENSADATIENAVVRTDGRNMRYSNSGKIDKAVFEFRPTGAETIRVLKAEQLNSDERVYAKVSTCKYSVSGTQVYIVGAPELKVKIADYIYANVTRPVTDVNGDKNYGGLSRADANGYHTFTVQSGDTELVLNQGTTVTKYTLTLTDATANPTKTKYNDGEEITLTAKDAAEGKEFDKWELDGLTLVDDYQETNATIKVTITGNATAKATYKTVTPTPGGDDDQPKTYTVTVKGGKINGETEVKAEKDTKLTMDVDEKEVPEGMTFDVWSISFPEGVKDTLTPSVKLHDPHMTFTMPEADITIEAQYRSSELPGEDDGPSALGTMATVAVGGAAAGILVWQGVSLGVDSYLQLNLPKGVAVPANRRELVVLLWETAGKPETALPSLYSDLPAEEIELQKATRWAIDNGLVKPADDSDASRFDPDRYVTKYDVFGAWLKLKKLMK